MKNKRTIVGIMLLLMLALPFSYAQEANETFEVKGGNEYPLLSRALDRIKLAFTAQIERRVALMEKIAQRRADHYQFLLAKGKTEQAERFNASTVGLIKNFDQWKANKGRIVEEFEQKAAEKQNQTRNQTRDDAMERKPSKNETDTNSTRSGRGY